MTYNVFGGTLNLAQPNQSYLGTGHIIGVDLSWEELNVTSNCT